MNDIIIKIKNELVTLYQLKDSVLTEMMQSGEVMTDLSVLDAKIETFEKVLKMINSRNSEE